MRRTNIARLKDTFTTDSGTYRKLEADDGRTFYTRDGSFISRQAWAGAHGGLDVFQEEAREIARDAVADLDLLEEEFDADTIAELEALFWEVFREMYGEIAA